MSARTRSRWWRSTPSQRRCARGAISRRAATSGLIPFERTARTLRRWRGEVLNYQRDPITNAVVEGKHNRVKVLKRRAYDYRNNRTFQYRILNLLHTH